MAQAAISIQMDQAVGVTTMPEKMSLQVSTKMLKNFRKVSLEIEKRECKVKATGGGSAGWLAYILGQSGVDAVATFKGGAR